MKTAANASIKAIRFGGLAGSIIGFGLIPIFLRYFSDTLDAWTVNGIRYSFGALFWLPFLLLLDRSPAPPSTSSGLAKRRNVWLDAIVPSIANTISQALFALGPYYVSASSLGFVMRLAFLFTIVFGFIVLAEERLLAKKASFWLGVALSFLGVLVMYYESFVGEGMSIGLLFVLGAAVAMGCYTVSVRYYMSTYSARESFSVISLYTSILLVSLMFCAGDYGRLSEISLECWGLLVVSALIGIAFGHVLLYQAIQYFGPVVASGVQLITPFVTYLAASICLGERMTLLEWTGGIILVISGALLVIARLQISSQAPPESKADEQPTLPLRPDLCTPIAIPHVCLEPESVAVGTRG